ncbi:MAG: helix-turn-helix domain-containing protein, partial [Deferribacteraceae bacterium]|nr:helix-turn-helix domain-containing protein [Deferribacteraceae bacterium]
MTNISENIKQQRYLRKLTQEELAALSGVALPTIKKVESGKTGVRSSTIEAIAAALAVDMATLLLPARRLHTIHFRTCRNMRSKEGIVAEIINKLDCYNALEKSTGQLLNPLYKQAFDLESPKHTAAMCRQLAGMDDINPVADITLALTALGVKAFPICINTDKFFSLSVGEIDGGPAIIVNASPLVSYEQGAFSAIHELGHLILHNKQERSLTDDIIWAEEDEADSFASHFLLPERGLQ